VDVAAHGDGAVHRLHVGLLDEYLLHLDDQARYTAVTRYTCIHTVTSTDTHTAQVAIIPELAAKNS
jgi:hypothetical protein